MAYQSSQNFLDNDSLDTLGALHKVLIEQGDKPALLALQKDTVEQWSYAELTEQSQRLAQGLAAAGIGKGDVVVLLADNNPAWIIACLAVLQAGAVVTPLDTQLSVEVLSHILDDSRPSLIFTSAAKVDRLAGLETEVKPQLVLLNAAEDDQRSWRQLLKDVHEDLPTVAPEDTATLFYTSGTTGPPKGVPLTHGNLAFQLTTIKQAKLVSEDDRVLLPLPLHHVYPFVVGLLAPLSLGLPLILPHALTGPQLVRSLREGQVSLIIGVPRLYSALYDGIRTRVESSGRIAAALFKAGLGLSGWLRRRLGLRLGKWLLHPLHKEFAPNLRVLASGGSPLDPELARMLEDLGWQVAVGYGLTETAPLLTINPLGEARLDSVGRPVPGVEVRIADAEEGDSHQRNTHRQGEILARGPNVFTGYHNLPDKTQEAFTDDGWFRTGDLGYLDEDGYLHVAGRTSTLIVTEGGENIQPDQVEEAYLQSPFIQEIGVLQQDNRLVAVIVPASNAIFRQKDGDIERTIREAVNQSAGSLPSYQRIADYVIDRDPLPRTRLGKIRRHLLEERYQKIREGKTAEISEQPIAIEEMTEEDQTLLADPTARQVWDWLAERYADRRLTPDSSPQLDLGIDSLAWLDVTLAIRQRVGAELSDEAISRIDTVRDLLREVTEAEKAGPQALPLEQPETVLSDIQRRWLRPLNAFQAGLSRWLYALNRGVIRSVFRLRVIGLENVPEQDAFVLTPNHTSSLDPFAIAAALDYRQLRRMYWGGWTGIAFHNPVNRLVSRLAQVVPLDPQRAVLSSLAFGAAVLKRGRSLVWFPEGQRSPDGKLQPFKPGIGMLLAHFQAPAVPVYIQGTYAALPRGHWLPRLKRITVVFGQPLDADTLRQQSQAEHAQERIVQALHEQVAQLSKQAGVD